MQIYKIITISIISLYGFSAQGFGEELLKDKRLKSVITQPMKHRINSVLLGSTAIALSAFGIHVGYNSACSIFDFLKSEPKTLLNGAFCMFHLMAITNIVPLALRTSSNIEFCAYTELKIARDIENQKNIRP